MLYQPHAGLGPAVWVDQRGFDIRRHVLARAVSAPGDEDALLSVCAELNSRRLDRSRPLWEMWLLVGLADGRAGLLIRLYHDGIGALAMMAAVFDPGPDPGAGKAVSADPERVVRPVPSARELVADDLRRQFHLGAAS